MTGDETPIDVAFARCELLERIVDKARTLALSDPLHDRNAAIGFLTRGERPSKRRATQDIELAFEALGMLINRITLLEMTAAFEGLYAAKLGNALGDARKHLREARSFSALYADREDLVRRLEDLRGLGGAISLLGARLGTKEKQDRLNAIHKNRNGFAHGIDTRLIPTIMREDVRDTLNELATWL